MERNTNEQGLQCCPHCKKEFKQLSRHVPNCKKRPESEAGTPSVKCDIEVHPVDHAPTGRIIAPKEEGQDVQEKPREMCSGCGETFIHLQKHKSRCRGLKLQKTDNQSPPFPEGCLESKLMSSQRSSPSILISATGDITEDRSKKDTICPENSAGSRTFISARTSLTEPCKEKGNETCPYCEKSFKCVAKHIRACKMKNDERDADDIIECRPAQSGKEDLDIQEYEKKKLPSVLGMNIKCAIQEEKESKKVTKDGDNGSRRLELQDSGPTPDRKYQKSAPSMEQVKPLTSCPYCGRGFIQLPKHLRACKKRPDFSSDPSSMNKTDVQSQSSEQAQQKQIRPKCSKRNEHITETQGSVDVLRFAVDEDYAEANSDQKNGPRNTDYLRPQEMLHSPISINSSFLANIAYSEDPKAELDKLQAGNEIDELEISEAEKVVKEMEVSFLQRLNDCNNFKWTIFRTGSYSDKTKIKSANEFDFIVSIGIKCIVQCLQEPDTLGYCLVVPILDSNVPHYISSLMTDNYLDPILVKKMAFNLFNQVILDADFRKGRRIKRLYRDVGSPAFTITYKSGGGKEYEIDLVPAIHSDGWPPISAIKDWKPKWQHTQSLEDLKKDYFAVARENPNAKNVHQGELLWRLSFSRTEKLLWLSVDSDRSLPTCRKKILKFLKGILEECKNNNAAVMTHLSSFHLRTFMLHQYDRKPDDKDWLETKRRQCLHVCIMELIRILSSKQMDNYYVRGHNVLKQVEVKEVQIFIEALTHASGAF
ncbi:hypothetical protein CHS0354_020281 [Potamilus streckersoni]|uniref:Uncharacterized protein n=1 Tax=Potamilus streckersoni TaxID=2493646 RepID=A0AAE0S642_9BIVA|nr:hypothetical protein CHS0354_020281 [Potamilus streckersoni]